MSFSLGKKLFQKKKDNSSEITINNQSLENSNHLGSINKCDNYHVGIGKMAAFFAHEIRNPLTSIIGFSQYLEQKSAIKADPNISHYISIIKEEALKMELMIQELLSLSTSHLEHDNLSIIDVRHSIEKIITIYSIQTADKNITFKTNLAEETYITGNTIRFERMLVNLIKNAIEAIQENGIIEIIVTKADNFIFISIIDSGPGIPVEQLEQIFFPFFTTKDVGTGIGLPICKAIIETLNGTMTIENHPSKGVHVKMKIPQNQRKH